MIKIRPAPASAAEGSVKDTYEVEVIPTIESYAAIVYDVDADEE
jgi:hypothetical protein